MSAGVGAVIWVSRDLPKPNTFIERDLPLSTRIYDRTGKNILFEVHGVEKRTRIKLDEIPDYLKWATLVAEDRSFYQHGGIKLTSIVRAELKNILSGSKSQGASTITQQFIKNAVLTPEKKYSRKIKEIILAWRMENVFTKDEILEMYFNEIPYGSVAYGAASAADIYFGKNISDITLAESAVIAALPKAPTYYSPYGSHKDELLGRQKFILNQMVKEGYITQKKADDAKNEKLNFKRPRGSITAPHFVMYVKELLARKYGEKTVEQGGLKVITTLDLYKQKKGEEAILKWGERNADNYNANNAALVAIDPKTGEILTMVGSRDYFDDKNDGQVNVSMRPRQPGSSFKPIVYAAGFEQGLSPDTILFDVKTVFKTDQKDYEPNNYNGKTYGPVSIKNALAGSLNIPAVKTIYLVGIENVLNLADTLGYSTLKDRSRFGLSLVLGGGEVKLLEHVSAFGVFARDGIKQKPVAILRIEDSKGKILEEYKPNEGERVLDSTAVRQINSILSDNSARSYVFGEKNLLTLGGRPVAAKTGTTNDNRDAWTIGYTPSIAAGVWVGNNDFSKMSDRAVGASVAAPIWNTFMSSVLGDTPVENFKKPPVIPLPDKPMLNGKIGSEEIIRIDKITGKRATEYTPISTIEEKTFQTLHSILHYATPGNILGPEPKDPTKDPNYKTWEEGVILWAEENNVKTTETPPEEFDNLHTLENKPSIQITNPLNKILTSATINIEVKTKARRGVKIVKFYINNQLIGVTKEPPFSLKYTIKKLPNGTHELKAEAFDDIENSGSDSVQFTLNLPEELAPFAVNWITPNTKTSVTLKNFPYPLLIYVSKPKLVKKVDFYYRSKGSNISKWLGFKQKIQNKNQFSAIWEDPPPLGSYIVYAVLSDINGSIVRSREIEINVVE